MTTTTESLGETGPAPVRIDAAGYQVGLPALPPGYSSQVAWGFCDPADGQLYEFIRVYQPARDRHGLGPICLLDEQLSHWLTSYTPDVAESGPPRMLCRWIDFARARTLAGRGLTFLRFSSPLQGPEHTPRLLQLASFSASGGPAARAPAGLGLGRLAEDVLPGG
jgi:hypothetical protein